jgi:hypothetical protein
MGGGGGGEFGSIVPVFTLSVPIFDDLAPRLVWASAQTSTFTVFPERLLGAPKLLDHLVPTAVIAEVVAGEPDFTKRRITLLTVAPPVGLTTMEAVTLPPLATVPALSLWLLKVIFGFGGAATPGRTRLRGRIAADVSATAISGRLIIQNALRKGGAGSPRRC